MLLLAAQTDATGIADDFDGRIDAGLATLYSGRFEDAVDTFNAFIAEHPANPTGYFFRAGAYQVRMTDLESDGFLKPFTATLDSALMLSNRSIKANGRDAWAYFIRGGTCSYLAARDARKSSYVSALHNGLSALSDFKKALAIDRTLYDAYLGVGMFHYARTRAVSILKWLPFIGDTRDQGIGEIRLAIAKGRYSRVMAQNGLVWILCDAKRYVEAIPLARELEQEFPESAFFHWALPDIYWNTGRLDLAEPAYENLLRLVEAGRPANNHNRVVITFRISHCLLQAKRYREAAAYADRCINYALDDALAKKLATERRKALNVRDAALKRLKKQG